MSTENTTPRMWEVKHPFCGPDQGEHVEFASWEEMRDALRGIDKDLNVVFRWDWDDYSQPHYDHLTLDDDEREDQRLRVFLVLPRKSRLMEWECPVIHDDEPDVRDVLAEHADYLQGLWHPIRFPSSAENSARSDDGGGA